MAMITACRSCGGRDLPLVLSLGQTPLANALLTDAQLGRPEPTFPLDLVFCRQCALVQITDAVPPEVLFQQYAYFSSVSETMLRHAKALVERIAKMQALNRDSLVVEIASNDGYLLRNLVDDGIPVLGIEPARNVADVARQQGVPTIEEFFSETLARELVATRGPADVIIANNVMAHVPAINGVVAGLKHLLKPDGIFVMETPYVRDLVSRLEFDTIYHEHVFYYSMTALDRLFRRHGLVPSEVERIPIHGGSLRVTVAHEGREGEQRSVRELLADEQEAGVGEFACYRSFAERVASLQKELRDCLNGLKAQGKRLAGYGAAAKGSVLLNAIQADRRLLDYVVDRSAYKQGRYMPGVRLPIYPPEILEEDAPDYVLLLAWNIAEEIMQQQSVYRQRGGRFILPIPSPHVV